MHQLFQTTSNRYSKVQRGVSSIEFALLLPMLLVMFDAVVELGLLMYNQSVLTSAASLAARMGVAQASPALTQAEIVAVASDYCISNLVMTDASAPLINIIQVAQPNFQAPLRISASYTYKGFLLGSLLSAIPSSQQFSSSVVMYQQ